MRPSSPAKALAAAALAAALAGACSDGPPPPAPSPSAVASQSAAPAPAPPRAKLPANTREGAMIARAVGEPALYVADEDTRSLVKIALPLDSNSKPVAVALPGAPSAVLPLNGRVLVVVRALAPEPGKPPKPPGLLLVMRPDEALGAVVEEHRVELPADAWGVAITPDEKTAIVTSAWTHRVSAVDLEKGAVRFSVDVGREPRGVVVAPDGKTAYVTHLVRASLTRIDGIDTSDPKPRVVPFPAAPIRTLPERGDAATLGYAPVLSPDGARLLVARQALGATGKRAWNGQATVDVMTLPDEQPLAVKPKRWFKMISKRFMKRDVLSMNDVTLTGPGPVMERQPFIQPRAVSYRRATHTLLVASEGTDELVELDALAIDPAVKPVRTYDIGAAPRFIRSFFGDPADRPKDPPVGDTLCGGPSGVALSADESTAHVFCKSSRRVAAVALDPLTPGQERANLPAPVYVDLGREPLSEQAALGRRLYVNAKDSNISGSYACNGCHPEGRDDGHVWHEDEQINDKLPSATNLHAYEMSFGFAEKGMAQGSKGAPRQTPMLAGRVRAKGPYGWKGRSPDLRHRVVTGFVLHRWMNDGFWSFGDGAIARAEPIMAFAREGLVPPPREERALTPEEERGQRVFADPNVGCATCHVPNDGEHTNRALAGLGAFAYDKARFDPELEEDHRFKTPSLRSVGGTPPYYHDGSEPTLESLIEHNGTRMGHTRQLSADDKKALIAFLRTL